MHCWPVILRELQVAARRSATYRQRLFVGGIACAAVGIWAWYSQVVSSTSGENLFGLVSDVALILCLLEGVRETSDCLSSERREGTLGLLFLTDLTARDVILGKLSAGSVKSFTTLLSMMPAFALPIFMGGVTGGEYWRVMLSLFAALICAMMCGMVVSAICESVLTAMAGTVLVFFLLFVLPMLLPIPPWLAGPIGMFRHAGGSRWSLDYTSYWNAALYSAAWCAVLFWVAAFLLARLSKIERTYKPKGVLSKLMQPPRGVAVAWGSISGMNDPAVWLSERTLPGRKPLWLLVFIVTLICIIVGCLSGPKAYPFLFAVPMFLGFVLKLWVAVVAVQPFSQARRSGALELVLCTPVTAHRLVRAHVDAVRGYFMAPGLTLACLPGFAGVICAGIAGGDAGEFVLATIMVGMVWLLLFTLDLNALTYTGLWFGLKEAEPQRAITKTVFRVLLLPWLTCVIPCVGFFGMLIWPAVWIGWGSKQLDKHFLEEATKPVERT